MQRFPPKQNTRLTKAIKESKDISFVQTKERKGDSPLISESQRDALRFVEDRMEDAAESTVK